MPFGLEVKQANPEATATAKPTGIEKPVPNLSLKDLRFYNPNAHLFPIPEPCVKECPLRSLLITEDMVNCFLKFRSDTVHRFANLNDQFKKQMFDRCMGCWVNALYKDKSEMQTHRFALHSFLIFGRADLMMYDAKVTMTQPCVDCQGTSTIGQLPHFKLASYK